MVLPTSDVDGDDLTCSIVSSPGNGTLTSLGPCLYRFTPVGSYSGNDSFTYKANDGAEDSGNATVSLIIKNTFNTTLPNQDPLADFRLPARGLELLVNHQMNPMQPFDANSGLSYTYTLEGELPAGLNFTPSSGRIEGAPTAPDYRVVKICRDPKTGAHDCQELHIFAQAKRLITGHTSVNPALCTSPAGNGNTADPIQISTVAHLECIRNYPDRAFRIMNEIDFLLNPFAQLPRFTGYLDGQNFAFRNYRSTSGSALFLEIAGQAIIVNLGLRGFEITGGVNGVGALAHTLAGGVLEGIVLENVKVYGDNFVGGLIGKVLSPSLVPAYHGYIHQVNVSGLDIDSNSFASGTPGWSRSGGLIGTILHTPFRVSNVRFSGSNVIQGDSFVGAVIGQNATNWNPATDYANLWIDRVSVNSGTSVLGAAFASGLVSAMNNGDALTNSYSLAAVTGTNISGAGLQGFPYNNGNGQCSHVVNSYFAGTMSFPGGGGAGIVSGNTNYTGIGSVMIVNTATLSTLTYPVTGGVTAVSVSNQSITDADFRVPSHPAFATWAVPPWIFVNGSYPAL
ncbi:hypothetical protein EB061_08095 [bacterium]|nr:hypothetical protein [bacterium]